MVQSASGARRLQARLLLVLVAVTMAVFAGVCGHEFVYFDDNVNIYGNPHVQGLSWESLKWMFTDTSFARRYMPLGWLGYAVDCQLFGLNPRAHHAMSLLLHVLNVLLLYFLLKRLLMLAYRSDTTVEQAKAPVWCAAAATLFWAVNPLRVEAVAWASSIIYCLAFLLATGSLLTWLHAQDPGIPKSRRRLLYWLAVVAFAASLLTYPLALFAPLGLLILEIYPLRRIGATRPANGCEPTHNPVTDEDGPVGRGFVRALSAWWQPAAWPLWRDKLPFIGLSVMGLVTSAWARMLTDAAHRPVSLENFSLFSRAMQAVYIWAYYAWKPWAPYHLAPSYATLHSFNPLGFGFLASAAFLLLVSVGLLLWRRRWPAALAIWVCHLVILVPVLGLSEYPHSPSDRYSYLQGTLWSIGLAVLLRSWWVRGKQGRLAATALTGATLLFALSAWQQVAVWSNTITLHEHLLARLGEHPCRARFDEVLGVQYLRYGLTNEAETSFQNILYYESRRADRNIYQEQLIPRTHVRLGDLCADQGKPEAALVHYRAALELEPGSVIARLNIGSTLAILHREAEAVEYFQEVLRLAPGSSEAHHNLALAFRKLGREQEALGHFQEERRLLARK